MGGETKRARTVFAHRGPDPNQDGALAVADHPMLLFEHHGESERWLPVAGFEDFYQVSDLGRLWSFHSGAGRHGGLRRLSPDSTGYLNTTLYGIGRRESRRIHQLVMEVFVGPCPPGMEVLHGPGGPRDNRLVNLRYGTSQENSDDMTRGATQSRGEDRPAAKLTEVRVRELRRRYARPGHPSQQALAREYNVSRGTIAKAVTRQTWRHVA